ncbi:DUF7373 family lipoprotein [Nocardia asteroides]|uniref:Uncharacterized protein n=1 Tax=Nocardia asteroides NBRC 15531 TaxID=1110697 RepID=U5EHK7_NOCAS|nr:hypothetical protein [Nocardia asteroides]UGT51171.1 hypothetical protein LT345_11795 [Nocardia asteroides]GAD85881.1 hypothetical protein NCAST_32_03650 [Nocardia asteroides NBRC 15531]
MSFALGLTLAALTGCAVTGDPRPVPDPASLDVGPYSRYPLAAPTRGSEHYGRVIESVRLGELVANPARVDPALHVPRTRSGSDPLPTPAKAAALLADPVREVLERHGMLAGFTVGASDTRQFAIGSGRIVQITLLRFPDAATARQAATEIDSADAAMSPDNVAVTIPDHPAARAHWRPSVPTLAATMAVDSFVVTVLAGHTTPDLGVLTTLAGRVFLEQQPLLRDVTLTPPAAFADLPLDRDGMLGRMVPEAPGRWPYPVVITSEFAETAGWDGLVQPHGIILGPRAGHFASPAPEVPELTGLNRFDRLLRFADTATATTFFSGLQQDDPRSSVPPPAGMVDINCAEREGGAPMTRFSCRLRHGRYVAVVFSRDYQDVHHRAAAQYALLVNSE